MEWHPKNHTKGILKLLIQRPKPIHHLFRHSYIPIIKLLIQRPQNSKAIYDQTWPLICIPHPKPRRLSYVGKLNMSYECFLGEHWLLFVSIDIHNKEDERRLYFAKEVEWIGDVSLGTLSLLAEKDWCLINPFVLWKDAAAVFYSSHIIIKSKIISSGWKLRKSLGRVKMR